MGIADNLAASQEARKEGAPQPGETQTDFNEGLPQEPPQAAQVGDIAPPAKEEPPAPAQKFKIGDKEFASVEEAMEFAQKLDSKAREREAFELGQESVKQAQAPEVPEVPKPSIEEIIQDELFDNPKEALKKYKEHIINEVKSTIKQESTQETQQKQLWDGFYEENPELVEHKELVEYTLERNWSELEAMEAKKGLQELASRTKSTIERIVKTMNPSAEVLPSGSAKVAGASNQATTKSQESSPKRVAFADQVRMLNKRTLQVPE